MTRPRSTPGPDHPIAITRTPERVRVLVGDIVIADTERALSLREANYPVVQYVPLADVDVSRLGETDTSSYCPYKGDASYYTVTGPDGDLVDAVWEYREPYESVAAIVGHVAFYPNKVTVVVG